MNVSNSIAKDNRTLQTLVAASLISLLSFNIQASDNHQRYCSSTASKIFKACHYEAREDVKIGSADCLNLSDADERQECRAEVAADFTENRGFCGEVKDARLEVCDLVGEGRYDPQLDPAEFVNPLNIGGTVAPNPYMPLIPGLIKVFKSDDEKVTVTVTERTLEIDGVTAIVVTDVVEEDDELVEVTDDYFAQDIYGNVWYMGEFVLNYEDGQISDLDGSFKAGEDGAKAGILVNAVPQVGDVYRQEWYLDEAEDVVQVLELGAFESVPAVSCEGNCMRTRDWTPLEPGTFENKFSLPGYGVILAYDVDDPDDREALVEINFPE